MRGFYAARMEQQSYTQPTLFSFAPESGTAPRTERDSRLCEPNPPPIRESDLDGAQLIHKKDLPGPLSFAYLQRTRAICELDSQSAYRSEDGASLYGRAAIMARMLPLGAQVCCTAAAWVWIGGDFPDTFDLLSKSHFRSAVHGRPIRAFARKVAPAHIITLAQLRITKPLRTVCDLALLPFDERANQGLPETAYALMHQYNITSGQCLAMLDELQYMHNSHHARSLLEFFQDYELHQARMESLEHRTQAARERFHNVSCEASALENGLSRQLAVQPARRAQQEQG